MTSDRIQLTAAQRALLTRCVAASVPMVEVMRELGWGNTMRALVRRGYVARVQEYRQVVLVATTAGIAAAARLRMTRRASTP